MAELWSDDEWRKQMSTAEINDLPDATFAYIEPGGKKDDEGKTVPRSLRHYPIHDAPHVRNALARAAAAIAGDTADAKEIAEKAMPKIKAAAKKFGIEVSDDDKTGEPDGEGRSKDCPTCTGSGKIREGHRKCPDCHGTGKAPDSKSSAPPSRKPRARRELARMPEFRLFQTGELRAGSPTSDGLVPVEGMVIRYDTPYTVRDMFGEFTETIHYGAAAPVLAANPDVRFLYGHNSQSMFPLARTGAVTDLTLTDSPDGLLIRALIDPRLDEARNLIVSLENGTITQMSVGMEVDPAGDVWSGEDDYGMPNVRDIFRLANVFDASAVTYPASTTTTIELAQRAWCALPIESRERVRHLWAIARNGRQGTLSQKDSDTLLHVIEQLAVADELDTRNAPTSQDAKVSKALVAAHQATAAALAAQVKDPDNNTDPVDKQVWKHLSDAHDSLTAAMKAQSKDGSPDAEDKTDGSGYQGNADGTNGTGGTNAPIPDNSDGTGSRSALPNVDRLLQVDQDLMRLRRPPVV